MKSRIWTAEDRAALIALVTVGKTKRQTAKALGRTPSAITRKIQSMAREYFIRLPKGWES